MDFANREIKDIWDQKSGTGQNGPWTNQKVLLKPSGTLLFWNIPEIKKEFINCTITANGMEEQTNSKGYKEFKNKKDSYVCLKDSNGKTVFEFPIPLNRTQRPTEPLIVTTNGIQETKYFECPHCHIRIYFNTYLI